MTPASLLKELESGTKAGQIKRQIIAHYINNGPTTTTDLAKTLSLSIPTVTKYISELDRYGYIADYGKLETAGGRHPTMYGLKPEAGFFIGVDVKHTSVNIGLIDFTGKMLVTDYELPFKLENTPECLDELCALVKDFIARQKEAIGQIDSNNILNVNINLPGRINPTTGCSYTLFTYFEDESLADYLTKTIGLRTSIDNDTRGMAYGEYTRGCATDRGAKHVLYLNMSWGVGLGIILNGEIYTGTSGFSGELGHISTWESEILCPCGKKGCLQTLCSGRAMHRILKERIMGGENSILSERVLKGEEISFKDIIKASQEEDILCLEILSEMGSYMGKQVAVLINLFNPEMIIVGGSLSLTGDFLTQAIKTLVNTYTLKVVNADTEITTACLGEEAGVIGACMLARKRRFADTV